MAFSTEVTANILDSISEGIFTVNKDFRISFFNRAAEEITGFDREEILGKFCKYVCQDSMCKEKCPISQVLQTGNNIHNLDSLLKHRNGHKINIRLNAAVLRNSEGEPVGGVISFRDVSYLEAIKKDLDKNTQFYGVVGYSKAMREIFNLIEEISESDAAVLIQGESGTGKEMIANAIQMNSLRKDKPYLKINCSVFSPQLLASELFGHVKGAFTGAVKDRPGRFEVAHTGTIFLDEIAEMPNQMQIQLLRVLQEGTFERVGESLTRKVDVRIIAATNKDIQTELKNGNFREDLYYRLNVIPIVIPPLRERYEDIPHLIQHFIQKYSLLNNKRIEGIEDEAMDLLLSYSWPGNVRELENAIEYAFARTNKDQLIRAEKLPPSIRSFAPVSPVSAYSESEAFQIQRLLEKHQWNKTKVAKELGMGRTTLWRKMRQYGLGGRS
ncbi:MAG: sigma 54-interacting transcriptional regulator [Calditrichia bacterium]